MAEKYLLAKHYCGYNKTEENTMKRTELTAQKMKDMGWVATFEDGYDLPLKDIVFNIQSKNEDGSWFWKLRCRDSANRFSKDEFGMCSTYRVYYKIETLEASADGENWFDIAQRKVETNRTCIYAD